MGIAECPHPSVWLSFSDGSKVSLPVEPGETVLDAALKAGAPVLYQCRSGACSTCVAQLVEGSAEMQSGTSSALLQSEVAEGQRLLCRTQVSADCGFSLGYDSTAGSGKPRKVLAFIDAVERIAEDAVRLVLELAEGENLPFKSGQYVQVTVPGTDQKRSYSIASPPSALPRLEMLIRLLPGGVMSSWLTGAAKRDDVLEIEGAFGSFFLAEKDPRPHVMVAGGTGLAPMMAMIDTIRERPGRKPPILLSFGCASERGLFFREAIELREFWLPSLDARISIERGEPGEGVHMGNPVEALDAVDPASVAYLCGPAGLIEAARVRLESFGVSPENIHSEQFVASE
ncbi:2Fe-2S iron-sulfur cluster binding domain-containing protein [Sphingobium sp. H39-3-25]|uniref:2Fe-2S iron-sulfur cluster binding domain-containing protein n=1 Tax=Sphingobium arseniciresistens TaxID=3030834 RepID=UPI0023B8DFCE|nr:2Fe-2S iron-sulfur cluster binding domain-containing protein [Sphingobium arseniciresistens]